EKGVLILTDMVGNVISELEIGPSKNVQRLILDTSELATGSYLVSIITDTEAMRKQLVVNR
ncbi:MAG: hypothetical protein HKN45_07200, partial [Flavobacteriales bacterium]|nr:hypothetical protein [Flavobacteriales bacterium]